jgi:hypothetical protein
LPPLLNTSKRQISEH